MGFDSSTAIDRISKDGYGARISDERLDLLNVDYLFLLIDRRNRATLLDKPLFRCPYAAEPRIRSSLFARQCLRIRPGYARKASAFGIAKRQASSWWYTAHSAASTPCRCGEY